MRTLALLLLLLNVCFLFWTQYIDVIGQDSESTSAAVSASTQRLQLATERVQSTIIARKNPALQSCISIGPFAQITDENMVQQKLQEAGFVVTSRTERGDVFAGYWVSLPSMSTRLEAETVLAKLHTSGIGDAYLLTEGAPANVISLGLFSEQANAERRRDEVINLGYTPTIQPRNRTGELGWLDIKLKQPGQDIDPMLLQPQVGAILRLESKACQKPS